MINGSCSLEQASRLTASGRRQRIHFYYEPQPDLHTRKHLYAAFGLSASSPVSINSVIDHW
eukprot:SAG31_NODE_4066_length_3623_cov_2.164302_4_plen_61_part_00